MYKFRLVFLSVLLIASFSSCKYFKSSNKDADIVARVNKKYLYLSDLRKAIPKKLSKADSTQYAKNYINNWIRQQLMLEKAESNLSKDQKDFQVLIDEYRNSLLLFTYEKELVRQKLDTVVTASQIEKYYNENPEQFKLKYNIINVRYVRVPNKAPDLQKLKKYIQSESAEDRSKLEDYCHKNAINFFLDDQSWLIFDDLLKEVPLTTYDQESYLKNHRFVEMQDSTSTYLVNIKGFKIKESTSPLSFEKDNVKNLILNQRKLDLIDNVGIQVFEDAKKHGGFEILKK